MNFTEFECPFPSEALKGCSMVRLEDGRLLHLSTFKAFIPKNERISGLSYQHGQHGEVIGASEQIPSILFAPISNLKSKTSGNVIDSVINNIIDYIRKLHENNFKLNYSGVNVAKHFCKNIMFFTNESESSFVFLEKFMIKSSNKKTNTIYLEKLTRSILLAFLFSPTKQRVYSCGLTCKLKNFNAKFPNYDYELIHNYFCKKTDNSLLDIYNVNNL